MSDIIIAADAIMVIKPLGNGKYMAMNKMHVIARRRYFVVCFIE